VYWLKVYQIPQAGRAARGKAIVNLINLAQGEKLAAILPVREFTDDRSIVMVTKKGIIKKTVLSAYANPRSTGIIAMSVDEGDDLIDVQITNNQQDIFLGTRKGKAIRFHAEDVRDLGRTARGVTGIRMDEDDCVVGVEILAEGNAILTVSENGYGKRTLVVEYPLQGRGGKGGPGNGETPLTGTTADKVNAAALAKYPGATVDRLETDSEGVYEAHLTTTDGTHIIVAVGTDFTVTGTQEMPAGGPGGGHGPNGTDPDPSDDDGPGTSNPGGSQQGTVPAPSQSGTA